MHLIPKAKPIRIRISVGGEEHSSLVTLLQKFEIEALFSLLQNGTLIRWLDQIGEHDIKNKLSLLQIKDYSNITDSVYIDFVKIFFCDISKMSQNIANYYKSCNNKEQIERWFRIASEYGNYEYAYELGEIYAKGLYGIPQSNTKAISYYEKATYNGILQARIELARHYSRGKGVEQSIEKAINLLEEVKIPQRPEIYYEIGNIYMLQDNYVKAIEHLEEAAKNNYTKAYLKLSALYYILEDYKNSEKWTKIAYDNNVELKTNYDLENLGNILYREKNPLAIEYYTRAAITSNSAKNKLGRIYESGQLNVKKDLSEAFYWYQSAAKEGDTIGKYNVGHCYMYGIGVEKNINLASLFFKEVAEKGDADAAINLILCYKSRGEFSQAHKLAMELAEDNNPDAMFLMGMFYEEGLGSIIRKNKYMAIDWYTKASEKGHTEAKIKLNKLLV